MTDFNKYGHRRYVIGGIAVCIVLLYTIRLVDLQILKDHYKKNAASNAFLMKNEFPSRGVITDRNNKLLVYNQLTYNIAVIVNEINPEMDTLDFCNTLGISKQQFIDRMSEIKDPRKNPWYSRFSQQMFKDRLTVREFSSLQEKLFRFPGFYVQKRAIRQYSHEGAAHVLGEVGEVSLADIEEDEYYQAGDYIGKSGVEKSYEQKLRGKKGIHIFLKDARGKVQGSYKNGRYDQNPQPGSNLTLSIDIDLQEKAEKLMEGRCGSIIAIEPQTGEILCMVSAPTYNQKMMSGKTRGEYHKILQADKNRPMLNRAIMGQYPPGSTFKPSQGLVFMQEGIASVSTAYPCERGFKYKRLKVGCHTHPSPLSIVPALATSCNSYFCWGLYNMMSDRTKYHTLHAAMSRWRDYMVSMGFGYKLGVDLPGEKRGLIPNAEFYDKAYFHKWNGLTIISISIGQGEVTLTPLQIANQAATIANRGYYIKPHVVKKVQGEPLDTAYTKRHYTMAARRYYEYIVRGMRSAVEYGTCTGADLPGISVCGKTGTAQNRGQDHSVFMGFAPMVHPKIAVAVYVENAGYGATAAVPIATKLMNYFFNRNRADKSNDAHINAKVQPIEKELKQSGHNDADDDNQTE